MLNFVSGMEHDWSGAVRGRCSITTPIHRWHAPFSLTVILLRLTQVSKWSGLTNPLELTAHSAGSVLMCGSVSVGRSSAGALDLCASKCHLFDQDD